MNDEDVVSFLGILIKKIEDSQFIFCLAPIWKILWKDHSFIQILKNIPTTKNVLE
jgi:hypothetical protein